MTIHLIHNPEDIKSKIKKATHQGSTIPNDFANKFYQNIKEQINLFLFKMFQMIEKEKSELD